MLEIYNKRINKRGKEIRNFVNYLNENYNIPHRVKFEIINYPCVIVEDDPCWGMFWGDYGYSKIIKIANDLEFYKGKIKGSYVHKNWYLIHSFTTIAHELYHYFQLRDEKEMIENWVDHHAEKMVLKYLSHYNCKSSLSKNYVLNKIKKRKEIKLKPYFFPVDPASYKENIIKIHFS